MGGGLTAAASLYLTGRGRAAAAPSPPKKIGWPFPRKKKIGAPTPEKKNLTENTVFRSFSSIFEHLRENGHQIRDLREKLRIYTYFQPCTTKFQPCRVPVKPSASVRVRPRPSAYPRSGCLGGGLAGA